MGDVMDLFVERVDGERYLFEDEWRDLLLFDEQIEVRGRDRSRCGHARRTTGRS